MTVGRQAAFWGIAVLVFVALLVLLRDVLTPFVAGLILAYLLDPVADRLERLGLNRLAAILVILVTCVLAFVLVLMLLAPLAANQIAAFLTKMPETVERLQALVAEQGAPILARFGTPEAMADVQKSIGAVAGQAASWFGGFLQSLWAGGQAVVNLLALLVITPVVAFYLLMDWDRMVETVDGWLPRQHAGTIRDLMRQIDGAIAGFLRGQALVCLILGTAYALVLSLLGLNFGALIGLASGLLGFIPFIGALTGLVLAVGVALVQFWPDWVMPLVILGVFLAGQFIEGNILSPKLVGHSVGLHPVWLMFALLAFGSLFGFVGLLLAVPLAAIIGVLVRFMLGRYLASPLHLGTGTSPVPLDPPPARSRPIGAARRRRVPPPQG